MQKQYFWVTLLVCSAVLSGPVATFAAEPELPPVPSFDPSNPLAALPDDITPIAPEKIPDATKDKEESAAEASAEDLPLPKGDDSFEFFQPGYQMTGDDDEEKEKKPEKVIEIKPEPKKAARGPLPLVRFNYKNQHLPPPIYKKVYDSQNHHLPTAMYESDYDAATFSAVMQNNVNGLRAMLNGGRDIEMRSPQGESLVAVAVRYGAHDCLRLLLMRGADPSSAPAQQTQMAHYALQAAGYR